MIDLKNKRVLVVGIGKSGLAAARFLKARGARVTVSDSRPATLIAELSELLDEGFMVEAGSHGLLTFRRQDLIVVSPGVPQTTPELMTVRAMGAHIIGELELGAQFLQGEVVAITGSNGKTTTTTLAGEILKAAGRKTLVGGNIGLPVTAMVEESERLSGGLPSGAKAPLSEVADDVRAEARTLQSEAPTLQSEARTLQSEAPTLQSEAPTLQSAAHTLRAEDRTLQSEGEIGAGQKQEADPSATPQDDKSEDPSATPQDDKSKGNGGVWSVIEVSSFQLETVETFRPRIAMVLNITPDHLDRHGTFEAYAAAKARITEFQTAEDFLVLNAEDVEAQKIAAKSKAQIYWFSARRQIRQGAFVHGESVFYTAKEGAPPEPVLPVAEITLAGAHNVENVLAAVCAARLAGVSAEVIRGAVAGFKAVEHRLEFVREVGGVRYYNDSKATNVDAAMKAVGSFAGGVHLILGGKDKDSDYTTLAALLRERVKTVITIGSAAQKIEHQLAGVVKIERAETLQRAVALAGTLAAAGDTVLLAPACASFDQFKNYEERGRVFKDLVLGL